MDCLVSEWTKWSKRDTNGKITRTRDVKRHALNGGKKCPKLEQTQLSMFLIVSEFFKLSIEF